MSVSYRERCTKRRARGCVDLQGCTHSSKKQHVFYSTHVIHFCKTLAQQDDDHDALHPAAAPPAELAGRRPGSPGRRRRRRSLRSGGGGDDRLAGTRSIQLIKDCRRTTSSHKKGSLDRIESKSHSFYYSKSVHSSR